MENKKDNSVEVSNEIPFSEAKASKLLTDGFDKAKETIHDKDKVEELLRRAEDRLRNVRSKGFQKIAEALSYIPTFISLVRAYIKGTYREIPAGTIVAIVSALLYFVSPIDLIPDFVPVVGYADDAAVVMACLKLVRNDLDEYIAYRDKQ
ncbi:MAG: DUF1232 domain-containing protein [Clostridia bacterium]|nr:DUF1232 domain-containing protein [Clostridia bacterium]